MRATLLAAAAVILAAACAAAPAQAPTGSPAAVASRQGPAPSGATRIEGTVRTNVSGHVVLADGATFDLTRTTRIIRVQPGAMADLKSGLFVAITAKPQADGTLLASIVSVFPESLGRVVPPGQRPLSEGNLMTNAAIDQVSGNTFTVTFPGGAAKIAVAPDAQIIRQSDAQPDDLTAGAHVSATVVSGAAQSVQLLQ